MSTSVLLDGTPYPTLDIYLARGGGQALKKALGLSPEGVIEEIRKANLRGRGGAGFPTGIKWAGVRSKKTDILGCPPAKYLVCNCSEGEPGTYKDRYLIKKNPYPLLEGMAIAAYAIGTMHNVICIKGVFEKEIARLEAAIAELQTEGLLGENILGSGHTAWIEIVRGPDSYLLGEDRAMLEVIEGKPAWPRAKGLIPVEYGVYGQPTVVNNVETLSTVTHILRNGTDWFRSIGTKDSPGTMIFTLTGDVNRPGMYELPLGTPLQTLIQTCGGGVKIDRRLQAVFSGPTNAVIPADKINTPLDFASMRAIPSGLGSGGFTVYDDTACIIQAGLNFSRFLAIESCGQCTACKTGTGRITSRLERLEAGEATEEDVMAILDDCQHIKGAGRCFLITEEGIEINSILYHFADDVVEHLSYGCKKKRSLVMPKIKDFDEGTQTFVYDTAYYDRSFSEGRKIVYPA